MAQTPIRVGESGKPIRIDAGFDLSGYTELSLTFTDPSGNANEVTHASSPAVSAPATKVEDVDLGTLNASQYFEYTFPASQFDEAGSWTVRAKYTDTGADPDDIFISDQITITVEA